MKKTRLFMSGEKKCPFKCSYCFSEFECFDSDRELIKKMKVESVDIVESTIIYPCCDSEPNIDLAYINRILTLVRNYPKPVVSFSSKRRLTSRDISFLVGLDTSLRELGGRLKFSMSITNKNHIDLFESGASSYENRLLSLENLSKNNILTSVNIKPVLPFVNLGEYMSIIDDTNKLTKNFMVGDLYLDGKSDFSNRIVSDYPEHISERQISWLPSRPTWLVYNDHEKLEKIFSYIDSVGGKAFGSDAELITYICGTSL